MSELLSMFIYSGEARNSRTFKYTTEFNLMTSISWRLGMYWRYHFNKIQVLFLLKTFLLLACSQSLYSLYKHGYKIPAWFFSNIDKPLGSCTIFQSPITYCGLFQNLEPLRFPTVTLEIFFIFMENACWIFQDRTIFIAVDLKCIPPMREMSSRGANSPVLGFINYVKISAKNAPAVGDCLCKYD